MSAQEHSRRMRTARDVASRVRFDDLVPADRVFVTVLDRFRGPVVMGFDEICWTRDRFRSLPEHRVLAFWLDDELLWDKEQRVDNVFGSAGSGTTIVDVLARLEEQGAEEEDAATY